MGKLPSPAESFRAGRRAVRVTVAAAAAFYPAAHLLDQPVVALYALFTPITFGVLSPLPGGGRHRAGTVLRAAPAAAALVCLGTALAGAAWSAAAGMFLVGFALVLSAACAPRLAGVVPGLQLCYILACFPPYAPGSLPDRLAGVALGAASLAPCELLLFPQPLHRPYHGRIADALDVAARAAGLLARVDAVSPGTAGRLVAVGQDLRFSRQPSGTRPTGAGPRDRALAQAASATRRLLDQLAALARLPSCPADTTSLTLLHGIAAACAATAAELRGERPAAGPELIEEMTAQFLAERARPPERNAGPVHALLRRRSVLLTVAVSAVTARTAAALAAGTRRSAPGPVREQAWYAGLPAPRLWLMRIRGNLTPRSVVLQNAVRTALGLALARLVAGTLDLSHGFWVLLSVLTLARTTAGATWSTVRSAVVGTLAGAVAAGALLIGAGDATVVYACLLVPTMLVAFSVGPVGGPAWAQGLFTLMLSTAFAQIAPVTWRLEEARLVDVLTGSAVGLLCGLLAWPTGARSEMRRSAGELFRAAAPLVRATARAVTGRTAASGPAGSAGPFRPALHRLRIAEAAYAQYRTESASDAVDGGPDWLAALDYGSRVLVGAYWLPPSGGAPDLPPALLRWVDAATEDVASASLTAAGSPEGRVLVRVAPLPAGAVSRTAPDVLSVLVDVEVWLHALAADLAAATGVRETASAERT
ncbi:FUSC family protein [Streptomyces sp. NPDC003719]